MEDIRGADGTRGKERFRISIVFQRPNRRQGAVVNRQKGRMPPKRDRFPTKNTNAKGRSPGFRICDLLSLLARDLLLPLPPGPPAEGQLASFSNR